MESGDDPEFNAALQHDLARYFHARVEHELLRAAADAGRCGLAELLGMAPGA